MALKHVVIGGGTGYIGSCIVKALNSCFPSIKTTIISRMPGPNRISWQEIEINGLPKDTSTVINVAGQNIMKQPWTPGFKQNVYNSRVKTNKQLAEAVKNSNVESFVTISGVSYYPPDGKEYSEYDKCEKYDFLSELVHDWECAAELPKDCPTRHVNIRSGAVLGRTGGMIKQTFLVYFLGLGGNLGSGTQPMPWIHITDLVKLFLTAATEKEYKGIYNGVAPEIVTNAEFTKTFASTIGRPAFLNVPEFVLKPLLHKDRAGIMLEGPKVKPKRVIEAGFKYEYPTIAEACKQFAHLRYDLPY